MNKNWPRDELTRCRRQPIFVGPYWDILMQTQNCWEMLRYLRPRCGVRMVWVDAICINQKNNQERSEQVARMHKIYSGCWRVFLWLGPDVARGSGGRMYPVRREFPAFELLKPSPGGNEASSKKNTRLSLSAFRSLLGRRYFSRIWVIQELLLAPQVIIPVGDTIYCIDLAISLILQHQKPMGWSWEDLAAPWLRCIAGGRLSAGSLSDAMALTSKSQATDQRDRLFAILGLLPPKFFEGIFPDYTLSNQHVFVGLFCYCLIQRREVHLLLRGGGASVAGQYERSHLTWVPDKWETAFAPPEEPSARLLHAKELEVAFSKAYVGANEHQRGYGLDLFCFRDPPTDGRSEAQRDPAEQPPPWVMNLEKDVDNADYKESRLGMRPWFQDVSVNADTGTLSIRLTRLVSITASPEHIGSAASMELWCASIRQQPGTLGVIFLPIPEGQGASVLVGDEVFVLHPGNSPLIYFVLRRQSMAQGGTPNRFKLIAVCPFLYFGTRSRGDTITHASLESLQSNVYGDLGFLCSKLNRSTYDIYYLIRMYEHAIVPGFFYRNVRPAWDLLPLCLLVIRQDNDKRPRDVIGREGLLHIVQLFLDLVTCFHPMALHEPQFGRVFSPAQLDNLIAPYKAWSSVSMSWEWRFDDSWVSEDRISKSSATMNGWIKYLKEYLRELAAEMRLTPLYLAGHLGETDEDVMARIRAGPREEDRDQASPIRRHQLFDIYGLDGSTSMVQIV